MSAPNKGDWRIHPNSLSKEETAEVMQNSYSASFKGDSNMKERELRNYRRNQNIMERAAELLAKQQAEEKEKLRKEALLNQFGNQLSLNKNSIPELKNTKEVPLDKPITVWNSGNPKNFSGVSETSGHNKFGRSSNFSKPISEKTSSDS
mmetsp:Transcript_26992/g.37561  ORF Transcript_26992/g.37561 Transcript_26992/m.37561 type:complete len:149 (+) Transcript_26992:118-564(+)|eukprot:CAMPEP_0184483558 /NCGR_PEP_ID=MMETSP0113_2-20130426/5229_1 /TAXON_ID=91329 /ORGANISM="Norrisiella sphaerica, Strain BC52" /LENGTH=148 /DNA_ID=CAMNT_0026864051 /DNA_START=115 /DNA_END=561 /DNA_ORIENTATION=-